MTATAEHQVPPRVLLIAGSDSSGGAGLEADQKVLAVHQVYGATATTAVTVQNTLGVHDVHVIPPDVVGKQIRCVLEDFGSGVGVKIGMLASARTIEIVAGELKKFEVKSIILDPVMVSTSGTHLLPQDAVQALREFLVSQATVLTPNIAEAALLLQDAGMTFTDPRCLEDLKRLAQLIYKLGPQAVLLKGGHAPLKADYDLAQKEEERMLTIDVLYDGKEFTTIESPYLTSKNTHGTGCSLASAIAANIAHGEDLKPAVKHAVRFVGAGIKTSFQLGKGAGPINHFHNCQKLPFAAGYFIEYLLERPDVQPVWHAYTRHEFTNQMAQGTLPLEHFKSYLVQDYLYLTHFARTNALAGYKSKTMDAIMGSVQIVQNIEAEMRLHLEYCAEFGLTRSDIERQKESQACVAYSRYVLDIGQSEDWLALQIALAPCLLGYGVSARRMYDDTRSQRVGNRYWRWIENYAAMDYQEAVKKGSALIEQNALKQSPERIEELVRIFIRATEMEIEFWNFDAHLSLPRQ